MTMGHEAVGSTILMNACQNKHEKISPEYKQELGQFAYDSLLKLSECAK